MDENIILNIDLLLIKANNIKLNRYRSIEINDYLNPCIITINNICKKTFNENSRLYLFSQQQWYQNKLKQKFGRQNYLQINKVYWKVLKTLKN